jgi:hypothetical protein
MNNKHQHLKVGLVGFALLLAVLACSFNASTANIQSAKMARDYDGTDPTMVFDQDDTFYCIVDLANAPDGTVVKASWVAAEVEGVDPDTFIDEAELSTGSGSVHFDLSKNGLWPVGKYKVDIFLNDQLERTLEFTVQ